MSAATPREQTPSGWDLAGFRAFGEFLRVASPSVPGGEIHERPGVVAAVAPRTPDRSIFNSVLYESAAALKDAWADLAAAYESTGVRAWTVWAPETDRESLDFLESRGHAFDGAPRMMAIDDLTSLGPAPDVDLDSEPGWMELCRVNDVAYGYGGGTYAAGFGAEPGTGVRAYGARVEGLLASVAATLDVGEDCGVFAVATVPEARGRGLARGVIHRALLEARERGCRTSTLQASRDGFPVYERLGYRDLGAVCLRERRRPAA